jgi:uncharacterized protein
VDLVARESPNVRKIFAILALLCACVAPTLTRAQSSQIFAPATEEFPALTGRVVDDAGELDTATREALRARLQSLEEKTGDQLIVATVKSLHGGAVEDYANRLFRRWHLGEKGRNNGVLLLHAPNERKIRIEVGYGLEGTLTDAISKLILANAVAPRFKVNDFNGGMTRGVDDIIAVLSGDESFKRQAERRSESSWHWPAIHPVPAIALSAFGLLILYLLTLLLLKVILATLIALGWVAGPRRGFWHRIDRLWRPTGRAARTPGHSLAFASSSGSHSSSSSASSFGSSDSGSSSDSFSGGGGGDSGGGGASSDY